MDHYLLWRIVTDLRENPQINQSIPLKPYNQDHESSYIPLNLHGALFILFYVALVAPLIIDSVLFLNPFNRLKYEKKIHYNIFDKFLILVFFNLLCLFLLLLCLLILKFFRTKDILRVIGFRPK